jgi:hypothetical protein
VTRSVARTKYSLPNGAPTVVRICPDVRSGVRGVDHHALLHDDAHVGDVVRPLAEEDEVTRIDVAGCELGRGVVLGLGGAREGNTGWGAGA